MAAAACGMARGRKRMRHGINLERHYAESSDSRGHDSIRRSTRQCAKESAATAVFAATYQAKRTAVCMHCDHLTLGATPEKFKRKSRPWRVNNCSLFCFSPGADAGLTWQSKSKGRAHAFLAFDDYCPAVRLDERLDDGKT